ncbi:hypothetical protein ACFL2Q_09640 [Thermodesulfobacteriota bacterium]
MKDEKAQDATSSVGLPRRGKRRRLRSILLGLLILICGAVLGSGVTLVVMHKKLVYAVHHPEVVTDKIARRMKWHLDLSDEQARKVRAILSERRKALVKLFHENRPRLEEEIATYEKQVVEVLKPEQEVIWRKRFKRIRNKWFPRLPAKTKESGEKDPS